MEPFVAPGFAFGRASSRDMALGAGSVIHDCVDKPTSQGGVAKDFSERNPDTRATLMDMLMSDQPQVKALGYL